jgi:hypothetical protein
MKGLEVENSHFRERVAEMDVGCTSAWRRWRRSGTALTEQERLTALVEKLTTAPPAPSFWGVRGGACDAAIRPRMERTGPRRRRGEPKVYLSPLGFEVALATALPALAI